ncbi:MAG: transcriptional repressor [Micromonosporaceae bacterium]|nr:transcriptional repressor [Micromonosporaceae bacterium]
MTDHPRRATGRNTRQRCEIIALLEETSEFRSAQQLHAVLRGRGAKVGLTTVYRTLQTLTEAGEINTMRLPSGEQVFRRCSPGHHHHLICRDCSRTIEVVGKTVEAWTELVAARHGFTDVEHTLEIFGVCPQCASKRG